MKTEDCSNTKNDNSQLEGNEKLIGRREALNKAGLYALSTATMMVLMKSQAKALASTPMAPTAMPKPEGTTTWQRTTRS